MLIRGIFLLILVVMSPFSVRAADELLNAGRTSAIDFMLETAIRQQLIAGAVIVIGNRSGVVYTAARGRLSGHADAPLLSERTRFDVASLTKVVATTPSIMKLLEEGHISLLDPLTRWFPEFSGSRHEEATILNLLTHTSGINDFDIPVESPFAATLAKAASQKGSAVNDNSFRYADINFILLGELVQRISGTPLDRFSHENIFVHAAMNDTGFLPLAAMPATMEPAIAPTALNNGTLQSGIVQDMNARRLGGIAGHAGLFSSASDLSQFASMILNKGTRNGTRIFSERTIAQMTAPYFYHNGRIIRGLGWDISSPFSSPRGNYFSPMSFGHTGYSGSSLWIDPELDLYVILLTIRLNYHDIRHFNRLRSDISTLAVSIFSRQPIIGDELNELQIP